MGQGLLFADLDEEVEVKVEAKTEVKAEAKDEVKPPKPPIPPAGQQKQPESTARAARKIAPQSFDISYGGTTANLKFWLENSREGMWIRGLPGQSCPSAGPYFDREEAESDLAGMRRFYEENPRYAF
jgi:hypothetical protein